MGKIKVHVRGENIKQALDNLEGIYPGTRKRLMKGDQLDPFISIAVDGKISMEGMFHPLHEDSEIRFLPVFAGG